MWHDLKRSTAWRNLVWEEFQILKWLLSNEFIISCLSGNTPVWVRHSYGLCEIKSVQHLIYQPIIFHRPPQYRFNLKQKFNVQSNLKAWYLILYYSWINWKKTLILHCWMLNWMQTWDINYSLKIKVWLTTADHFRISTLKLWLINQKICRKSSFSSRWAKSHVNLAWMTVSLNERFWKISSDIKRHVLGALSASFRFPLANCFLYFPAWKMYNPHFPSR